VGHPHLAGAYRVPILIATIHGDVAAVGAVTAKNVIIPTRKVAATTIKVTVVNSVRTAKLAAAAVSAATLSVKPASPAAVFRSALAAGIAVMVPAATLPNAKPVLAENVKSAAEIRIKLAARAIVVIRSGLKKL